MGLVVTGDGRRAITGSSDRSVAVWDLGNGSVKRVYRGHTRGVRAVALTPDERFAITGSHDRTLRIWDLRSGLAEGSLEPHRGGVYGLALTPDGKHAVSAASCGTVRVWDIASRAVVASFEADGPFWSCAVGCSGRTVIAGDDFGQLHFLDLEGIG